MAKVKNISGASLLSEWIPGGELEDGATAEVPDTQPDGSPLHWSPDYFQIVDEKKKLAAKPDGKE